MYCNSLKNMIFNPGQLATRGCPFEDGGIEGSSRWALALTHMPRPQMRPRYHLASMQFFNNLAQLQMWAQSFLAQMRFSWISHECSCNLVNSSHQFIVLWPRIDIYAHPNTAYLVYGKSPHSAVAHKLSKVQPLLQKGCDGFCLSTMFVLLCWHNFVNSL